jgi:SAM-dependent methyltransferase
MTDADEGEAGIHTEVAAYYTDKLLTHGPTARGVDWKDVSGQHKRFFQLLRVVEPGKPFAIGEIGCGYGALVPYLAARGFDAQYVGCDISEEMITIARQLHGDALNASFLVGADLGGISDYVVASGIFNVRFGHDDAVWFNYVIATIGRMMQQARVAVAFNLLTGFADAHRKEQRLWYPDPGEFLGELIRRYGFRVTLFHDYELYEYTVAIRASEGSYP